MNFLPLLERHKVALVLIDKKLRAILFKVRSLDAVAILKELSEVFKEQTQANYELFDLREMRKIAKLLIDRGANPSARYDWSGIDGYTQFTSLRA